MKLPKKGFTLIELLIVITILGILSGVVFNVINVQELRKQARDAQRVADLKKIQSALEIYYADYRKYASTAGSWRTVSSSLGILTPNYISVLPVDPVGGGSSPCTLNTYNYYYLSATGATYRLVTIMETALSNDPSPCSSLGCGVATADFCYEVTNP